MARQLDVYLYDHLVGVLGQDDHGDISFQYAKSWLATPNAVPLSLSLSLREASFTRKECAGFFGGVLPEGDKREIIARNLAISARNDFAMLEKIGGECAGAVTFMPSGAGLPARGGHYLPLTEAELAEKLRQLPRRPLLAGEGHIRLSLAGAQDKLAVRIDRDQILLPLDGAPSTHILKPAIERFAGIVRNELLCMRLAGAIGLSAARVKLRTADEIDYLIVERYDRAEKGPGTLERIHQEDFCQALGIISESKYQTEGGPSLSACIDLLRRASTSPATDILRFTDGFIFNFLIGNNDAHGKNFSILYTRWPRQSLRTTFAPLYDLVCTDAYPELSPRMAMKIGSEYQPDRVFPRHFDQLAEEARLNKAALRRRVIAITRLIISKLPSVSSQDEISNAIAAHISQRSKHVFDRFDK